MAEVKNRPAAGRAADAHAKFRRPAHVPPKRRAELIEAVNRAVRELLPDAHHVHLSAISADPLFPPIASIPLKGPYREPKPRAGTVGAVCNAVKAELWKGPKEELPPGELTPGFVKEWFARMTRETMERFRAGQYAEALAYHAGDIPAAEFTDTDWQAFVALIPVRGGRRTRDRHTRILRERLVAAGLAVGGKGGVS